MKRLLVLDIWKGSGGGASKSALYSELSKLYAVEFLPFRMPVDRMLASYIKSFRPSIRRWRERKAVLDERAQKYPQSFRAVTAVWDREIKKVKGAYDAVLQIGSLFGPVEAGGAPYFSYHDSAVSNLDAMWKDWMPGDFDAYRNEWYGLERNMFAGMTGIMTYSRFVKDTLVRDYGVEPGKVSVVGSSLKIPGEYFIDWRKRGKQVLFISTDFKRKGGPEVLGIFERVVREVPDARLVMVGCVPRELEAAERPWLRKTGPLGRMDLIELYRASSVLLHPARFDAFPSVILEAANFEMPCVASSVCGIPEIIEDGKTGFLASPGDNGAFADKLVYLLKNEGALVEMGKNARNSVRERFHPSVIARNMGAVIG